MNRNQNVRFIRHRRILPVNTEEEREFVSVPNRVRISSMKTKVFRDIFKVKTNFNSELVIRIETIHHFAELANYRVGRQHNFLPGVRPADVPGLFLIDVLVVKVLQGGEVVVRVLGEAEGVVGKVVGAGLVVFAGEVSLVFFDFELCFEDCFDPHFAKDFVFF